MITAGIIGFGLAGRSFHARLIAADPRYDLSAVATSQAAAVSMDFRGVRCLKPIELIEDPAIELVIIASPHTSHAALTRAALEARKHVVVDKPFVLDAHEGRELSAFAQARGLVLAVFHNRRWDGDFLTARQLIDQQVLGELSRVLMCWDRNRPEVSHRWREQPELGGGVLIDLGTHMIDQALVLFGPPNTIHAEIEAQRPGSRIDDYFSLHFGYGVLQVKLSASSMMVAPRPRFAIHGSKAGWQRCGIDVQEEQLVGGMRPDDTEYGLEAPGTIMQADGGRAHPTLRGDWPQFYHAVAAAITDGAPPPVSAEDALAVLAVIERARESAALGSALAFRLPPSAPAASAPPA